MSSKKIHKRGSKFGYLLSILINLAILYVILFIPVWEYIFPITEDFVQTRGALALSTGVTIFMYCTFIAYDPRWFRNLMQAISNIFAIYSLWVFRQVFPLNFADSFANWVNIGLLLLIAIMALSTLIEFAAAVKNFRRTIQE